MIHGLHLVTLITKISIQMETPELSKQSGKWYRNFLGKFPENLNFVE